MKIEKKDVDGITILALTGRLDSATAGTVETEFNAAIESGVKALGVNLQGLDYISSAGLRVLLFTAKKLSAQNRTIVLCCAQDSVREIFEISGLISIFKIVEDEAAAIALLQSAAAESAT